MPSHGVNDYASDPDAPTTAIFAPLRYKCRAELLTWLITGANSVGPESCTHVKLSLIDKEAERSVFVGYIYPALTIYIYICLC